MRVDQIDIRLRPMRLIALFEMDGTPLKSVTDEETPILSMPARLRRAGMEITTLIDETASFAWAKLNARLVKLLLRGRRFNSTLVESDDVPFAVLAEREGVSRSYFARLVRLSYLAPHITQAILDGRQPRDLTAVKLLEHSRLPLAWDNQRTALGFA
jgi:site-specific DNA recombinase